MSDEPLRPKIASPALQELMDLCLVRGGKPLWAFAAPDRVGE